MGIPSYKYLSIKILFLAFVSYSDFGDSDFHAD